MLKNKAEDGQEAVPPEAVPHAAADPHARIKTILALTVGPVLAGAMAFIGLPVIGVAGGALLSFDSVAYSQSTELDAMKGDSPGFVAFRADPVWSSPEWAAIAGAQLTEDEALEGPRLARLESSPLTSWAAGFARSYLVIPMDTEPVFTWRTVRAPMTDAFAAGADICAGNDPAAGLAGWAPDSGTGYLTGFADVWEENSPVIVEAAVRSICPADLK